MDANVGVGIPFVCVCDVVYWCVRVSVFCTYVSLHVRISMVIVREHANVYQIARHDIHMSEMSIFPCTCECPKT